MIGAAVYKRWNDATLNTQIATLWPYAEDPANLLAASGQAGGSVAVPNEQTLPRARFHVLDQDPTGDTSEDKTFEQMFLLYVVALKRTDLQAHRLLIETAFENSQRFSANPFAVSGHDVTDVDFVRASIQVRDHACLLEMAYVCRYQRPRKFPT